MSKHFRAWKIDQDQLLPPSVQDYVPKDHLSRFVVGLVRESLDLSEIVGGYPSALGQPPFDPWLMTALLLNGYASGIYSSHRQGVYRARGLHDDCGGRPAGPPNDLRVPQATPHTARRAVRAGFEACREGRAGAAWACRARRHQDQGECVQTQGDELSAHEAAPERTAG